MSISEKELEDFIFHDLTVNDGQFLMSRGLYVHTFNRVIWERQLNIEPYGIIDIVGFYRDTGKIHINILELKIVDIDPNHFEQIARYKRGIIEYLNNTLKGKFKLIFNLFLIGPSIKSGHYIANEIKGLTVVEFSYDLNGLLFESSYGNWYRPDGEGKSFNDKIRSHAEKIY